MKTTRVLLLSEDRELEYWIQKRGDRVIRTSNEITQKMIEQQKIRLIVSYNYRYILRRDVIDYPELGCVNLHISYLPYNRGADPNIWSHLEGTPSGVTIHYIDEGVDTGPIIAQRLVPMDVSLDLIDSYEILQRTIKELFMEHYSLIKKGSFHVCYQNAKGSHHYVAQRPKLKKGYETKIKDLVPKKKNRK